MDQFEQPAKPVALLRHQIEDLILFLEPAGNLLDLIPEFLVRKRDEDLQHFNQAVQRVQKVLPLRCGMLLSCDETLLDMPDPGCHQLSAVQHKGHQAQQGEGSSNGRRRPPDGSARLGSQADLFADLTDEFLGLRISLRELLAQRIHVIVQGKGGVHQAILERGSPSKAFCEVGNSLIDDAPVASITVQRQREKTEYLRRVVRRHKDLAYHAPFPFGVFLQIVPPEDHQVITGLALPWWKDHQMFPEMTNDK